MKNNKAHSDQTQPEETVFESTASVIVVLDDDEADYTIRPMRESLRKHLASRGIFPSKLPEEEKQGQG